MRIKNGARNIPTYTAKEMQSTVFNDLTVRVRAPYLYCHQGNCEHIIIFTDIR